MADEAPTTELGAPHSVGNVLPGGTPSWSTFAELTDHVPELAWPTSVQTYDRMATDGQVEALYRGTTLPITQRVWSLNPNGARDALVEELSEDLGLPIMGQEDANVPRRPSGAFSFDQHLREALLSLLFGHYYFEQVGVIENGLWRLRKLAPRAPATIDELRIAKDGGLVAIRQGMIGSGPTRAAVIPVERLVGYVWEGDARRRWVGKSMLRSLYRHWLVKDRLIRVDAINLERPSGAPILEAAEGASKPQIEELGELAQTMKWGEHAGAAVPHGTVPHFPDGRAPDVVRSIQMHDEAMARAWMLMLIQLGQTQTGSRAVAGSFADFAALAVNAICDWFAGVFSMHVIEDYVEWNYGAVEEYAPLLHHRERRTDEDTPPTTEELTSLVDSGLLTVDEQTEKWLRSRRSMPPLEGGRPPAPKPMGEPVTADPPPVAAASRSQRAPLAVKAASDLAPGALPDRELRRQPYAHEVAAAVDYAQMEAIFTSAMDKAQALYERQVIPAQIAEARKAVATTKTGKARSRVTQADMARVGVPGMGLDELQAILLEAGQAGAASASAELVAQGAAIPPASKEALAAKIADQAAAMTELAASSLSTAAQRKAVQLAGGTANAVDVADGVVEYLTGLKHTWTIDQLQGAVTMAQNVGRLTTFARLPDQERATYYASELLDAATCEECVAIDGTEYQSLDDATGDYPSGGYSECLGGPRCRGTVIVVAGREQEAATP